MTSWPNAINGAIRRLPQNPECCSPRRIYTFFLLRLPLALLSIALNGSAHPFGELERTYHSALLQVEFVSGIRHEQVSSDEIRLKVSAEYWTWGPQVVKRGLR
jgi:hypothetical protein